MLKELLGLRAADRYRSFVGPSQIYDLISAMTFNLLTSAGLREHHRVLDIGCGSLRNGRLLIPYLARGNYFGVEPNRWLVQDGIRKEIGRDLVRLKRPTFSYAADLKAFTTPLQIDYAFAQSIFSHCGRDLVESWLAGITQHLKDTGVLFATFLTDEKDFAGSGWIYPGTVAFRPDTLKAIAAQFGLGFELIEWEHPGQIWGAFTKPQYDRGLIENGISWKRAVDKARRDAKAQRPQTA
jgi:cyclopropane fatty-acyl-phospholipid synthase-like methyltransferase